LLYQVSDRSPSGLSAFGAVFRDAIVATGAPPVCRRPQLGTSAHDLLHPAARGGCLMSGGLALLALALGIVTAVGGAYMMGILLRTGRPEAPALTTHLHSTTVFAHMTVAGLGLVTLIVYIAYGDEGMAWGTLVVLAVAALIGGAMFLVWTRDRHGDPDVVAHNKRRLVEQQLPSAAVHTHGALAFATLICVLLLALGVGV
jgi:hypothetical protein